MPAGKIIATAGAIALFIFGIWAALPLFVNKEVDEGLPGQEEPLGQALETAGPEAVAVSGEGQFTGFDALHQASGTVRIVEVDGKKYVRFENDFTVTNGPDLFVHLGRNNQYSAEANLGRLKGNKGSQNYEIPDGVDLSQYTEVWVWCRAFSVPFGRATLQ